MKRSFYLLALLFAAFVTPRAAFAEPRPLGATAAVLPYTPSKLLADPTRARVYATDPATNSLVVIDTTSLRVIAKVSVGSNPVDMAISAAGNTLYVASSGASLTAVTSVDLNNFLVRATFSLPGTAEAIATVNGLVYVSAVDVRGQSTLYQLDGGTGAVQSSFGQNYRASSFLQFSPDGRTLFTSGYGSSGSGTLRSFDVSATPPTALQTVDNVGGGSHQLVVSRNGKYLCVASGTGSNGFYHTTLFSAADLTASYGTFEIGAYPGPLAFSPDDSLLYQTCTGLSNTVKIFDTATFAQVDGTQLPRLNGGGDAGSLPSAALDNTGSYLFVSETGPSLAGTGQLTVITTGRGTLRPATILPVISSNGIVTSAQDTPFDYRITATNSPSSFNAIDLPKGLSVNYSTGVISGTPTEFGSSTATISATNASGTVTALLAIEIDDNTGSAVPYVTTSTLPGGVVGQPYSAQVQANNSPTVYSGYGLPPGLSIDTATGIISGTPTTAGSFFAQLGAANPRRGNSSSSVSFTIILGTPIITSPATAAAYVGIPFTYQIAATGTPTRFAVSGLPAGLSVDPATGLITGTPTAVGSLSLVLSAANAVGTGTAKLAVGVTVVPPPVITSATTAAATLGRPFTYQITADNFPQGFAAAGLPDGLTLDAAAGLIFGTPARLGASAVTISASNGTGTGSAFLNLSVNPDLPLVTVTAVTPQISLSRGDVGEFVVTLSQAQDHDVVVSFVLKGTAINGTDYALTKGTKKIKAGKTSKSIKITPQGDLGGTGKKVVTLSVAPGDGYTVGTKEKIKIRIVQF